MKPIMCLLSISIAFTAFADTIKNNEPLPPIIIGTPNPSGGHRMPAKTYIYCEYSSGILVFHKLDIDTDYFVTVTHAETDATWSDIINSDNQSMCVGSISGSYSISITTDDDVNLVGYYTL